MGKSCDCSSIISRRGSVKIYKNYFDNLVETVYDAFLKLKFVPIDIEHNFVNNTVTFYGFSENFDVVEDYLVAPSYNLIISESEDGNVYSFEKIKTH